MLDIIGSIHIALPETIILLTAVLALLGDLFIPLKRYTIAYPIALCGILLAAVVSYLFIDQYPTVIFNRQFVSDDIAQLAKLFIYIIVFLCFVYSKPYLEERGIIRGEYYVLGLFATLGMTVMVSAHTTLTLYLGLELLSLPLYAMTAIRKSIADTSEAALKYFVMGAIASGLLLYGISLLYGATHHIDFFEISRSIAKLPADEMGLLSYALVFIVAGIGFKLAAAPFHMWVPDVYEGAPSAVTLFISSAPKVAAMVLTIRLFTMSLMDLSAEWQQLFLILALISTGLGNLLAIVQTNVKRMLAYSAISHSGYALFGLLALTQAGMAATLYYILLYGLMSAAAFGLIVLLSKSGVEIQQIDDLKGLNQRNPWLAFLMMIVLFSLAGIPPTVGFFTKFLVLKALVDARLLWVAALGLVFAVMGAFYYLRVIKVMYFDEASTTERLKIGKSSYALYSINALSLLLLGIFPSTLVSACIDAMVK